MGSPTSKAVTLDAPLPGVIGDSPAMAEVYRLTRKVAPSRATVLLIGETGTGKELIARAIHQLSPRRDGPYVRVNCGALSESLLESELFGHVKGAFTGAVENRSGRFEAAHAGSIFLDEIASLAAHLQVKLLRVLQEHEFERVGESKTIRVDTRVVAASNQFLEDEVEAGRFRDDLYYRLSVVPIQLPPLRERKEDIPALAEYFLDRYRRKNQKALKGITEAGMEILITHDWPGNVRELENDIERAVVMADGDWIDEAPLVEQIQKGRRLRRPDKDAVDVADAIRRVARAALAADSNGDGKLFDRVVAAVERELIEQALADCDQIQIKAADRLGINRNTLHNKVAKFGLGRNGDGGETS